MKYAAQWLLFATLAIAGVAHAQQFEEGTHYTRIDNAKPNAGKTIEVVEVFSFSCGHCFSFEPLIEAYEKQLPSDVKFKRLHIKWDKVTENLSRAYYTTEALKNPAAAAKMFEAIHVDRKRIVSPDDIEAVFVEAGIDAETFAKTFNSFGVTSQVKRADQLIKAYKIDSTPQLIVNGQYKIQPRANVSQKEMLEIADYLIALIRDGNT